MRYIALSLYSKFQLSRCRNDKKKWYRRTDGRTDGQTDDGTKSIVHIFLKCALIMNRKLMAQKTKHSDIPKNRYSNDFFLPRKYIFANALFLSTNIDLLYAQLTRRWSLFQQLVLAPSVCPLANIIIRAHFKKNGLYWNRYVVRPSVHLSARPSVRLSVCLWPISRSV
jgi:hypothetical protein